MNNLRSRFVIILTWALLLSWTATAQKQGEPTPNSGLSLTEGIAAGKELVSGILGMEPVKNLTNSGMLRVTTGDKTLSREVRFSTVLQGSNWISIYNSPGTKSEDSSTLKIIYARGQPNEYWFSQGTGALQQLNKDQLVLPFAGSDFWAIDLGLEFLHWDKQRVLRRQIRRGQLCNVLESVNPAPNPAGYSRVESWIDTESGGIVHADAYDVRGRLLKQFDPKEFRKVKGRWELERMEIRNRQTGSSTSIEFHLAS